MPLTLTPAQKEIADKIIAGAAAAKSAFAARDSTPGGYDASQIFSTAKLAHRLHIELESSGQSINHSPSMLKERNVPPSSLSFYEHLHSLEDFSGMLADAMVSSDL